VIGPGLAASLKKAADLINKDPKHKNQAKCVSDGLNLLQFYLQGDQYEFAKESCN